MSNSIIIVGGGGIGSSVAYFLATRLGDDANIIVVERDPTYQIASSSLSASSIRQQFSTPVSIQLSQFGYEFMAGLDKAGASDTTGVALTPRGYLFLGRADQENELRARTELARSLGVRLQEYTQEELRSAYNWLATDDLTYGVRGLDGEGWFDGYCLMQAYRSQAKAAGVKFVTGEVTNLVEQNGRVTSVQLADGRELTATIVVNTCGAWSDILASKVGLALPIRARRRSAYVISCPTPIPDFPILVDTSGIYVRPEQHHFLCTLSPSPEDDHDNLPLDPDLQRFEDVIWPTLAERIPSFEALRLERAWAGYYEYNTIDQNGIVGRTEIENFYVAAGFSGHGLMHSAGVGRGLAELIAHGEYRSIDLSPLSPNRFAEGRPIIEAGVY